MTVSEALTAIKNVKPNQYDDPTLIRWLSELDGRVWEDLLCRYAAETELPPLLPYGEEEGDRVLLIPFPYDDIYLKWLGAQIDYHNNELVRYQNAMEMFNEQMDAYMSAYSRTHQPAQKNDVQL